MELPRRMRLRSLGLRWCSLRWLCLLPTSPPVARRRSIRQWPSGTSEFYGLSGNNCFRLAGQGGEQDRETSLDRFAPRRKETCGCSDVDVRDEQPFFTVWLVAEQRPVGTHHCRSGRRPGACTVDSREIAGVLGGPAQGCFLMECVRRIGETRGHITA